MMIQRTTMECIYTKTHEIEQNKHQDSKLQKMELCDISDNFKKCKYTATHPTHTTYIWEIFQASYYPSVHYTNWGYKLSSMLPIPPLVLDQQESFVNEATMERTNSQQIKTTTLQDTHINESRTSMYQK